MNNKKKGEINISSIYSNLDNFDWEFYRDAYPDLSKIKNKQQAIKHWLNYGQYEGRKFSPQLLSSEDIKVKMATEKKKDPHKPVFRENLKVCITLVPRKSSFGGGNQFVNSLIDYLGDFNFKIVHKLEKGINVIFVIDPRINSSNKINIDSVIKYKKKYPQTYIIQRINDCDKPRGLKNVLDPLHLKGFQIADHVVFVSSWVYQYFKDNYSFNQRYSIINNGCNIKVFKNMKEKCPRIKNIKIVSHHWSTNYNKGFEFYNALDKIMSKRKDIEFTFICKDFCKEY